VLGYKADEAGSASDGDISAATDREAAHLVELVVERRALYVAVHEDTMLA
jgi:hypothetical protein